MTASSPLPARKPGLSPVAAVPLAVLAASTASIFVRYAQADAPSLAIAAWRMLIATAVLIPLALARHRRHAPHPTPGDLARIGLAGTCLAVHFATWITSVAYTSVASSVVLVSTAPLFVALLSPLLLREHLNRALALGLGLALLGVVVIAASDACTTSSGQPVCPSWRELLSGQAVRGDLLALAGAAAVAGYMLIGRDVRARMPLLPYITLAYGVAALVLLLFTALTRQTLLGYPATTYGWMALLALVPQLIAHSTYNWVLKYLPAASVAITLLGEPVGSTLLAFLLLGEVPSALKLAGAALILIGILWALHRPAPGGQA